MPTPRNQQVSLSDTTWYHCVSRCVRRSFLCGVDQVSGQDFSHRRGWVADRILFLSQIFSIDVAAYAVMSNHHHVVLRVDVEKSQNWSVEEVVQQWHKVYQGNFNSQRYLKEGSLPLAESIVLQRDAEIWRKRLMDISWFMKALNEPIARMANAEDNCTGRFYEGRFKSQALLDKQAILACMAYCDLNPIRAQLATTPETSDFTSIQTRINALKEGTIPAALATFQGSERKGQAGAIPFSLQDYIELVDTTGRAIRDDKRGHIDNNFPPILQRLKIDTETWLYIATTFEDSFGPWIGSTEKIQEACENTEKHWVHRTVGCQKLYPT